MNLHEFQAKRLFAGYRIPVPYGIAVESAEHALEAAQEMGGERWVVKAQAHTGGRGKAGGVVLADSPEQVQAEAQRMLDTRLVTKQTGEAGLPVSYILVEEPSEVPFQIRSVSGPRRPLTVMSRLRLMLPVNRPPSREPSAEEESSTDAVSSSSYAS